MKQPIVRRLGRVRLLCAISLVLLPSALALPVAPGAQGFGTETSAGRGGTVYKVTNLEDSVKDPPVGSFRWACKQEGPRVIVFEVAGVIALKGHLTIDNDNVTIAGQTAPWPGITLKDHQLTVRASDVLIQHIALRPGPAGGDSIYAVGVGTGSGSNPVFNPRNVVFDHLSCSWATDESVNTFGQDDRSISDVTYAYCIVSEPIANSPSLPHGSFGPYFGRNSDRVTLLRSILALSWYRNPQMQDTLRNAQVVDNFIYRPGMRDTDGIYVGNARSTEVVPLTVSAVGNVILRHPAPATYTVNGKTTEYTRVSRAGFYIKPTATEDLSVYLDNNRLYDPTGEGSWHPASGDPYDPSFFRPNGKNPRIEAADPHAAGSRVVSLNQTDVVSGDLTQLEITLRERAGKFPAMRDPYDAALFAKISSRTGKWNEGWAQILEEYGPNPWAAMESSERRTLHIPENPHETMPSGYTRLEEWLHAWSDLVEGRRTTPPDAG